MIRALLLELLFAEATRIAFFATQNSQLCIDACNTAVRIYNTEWGFAGAVMYAPRVPPGASTLS